MKHFLTIFFSLFTLVGAFLAVPAQAQGNFVKSFTSRFGSTVNKVYTTPADVTTSLPTAIGRIINMIVSFAGIILVVIIVYASFLWLTARGDDGQVVKAKNWIRNAIIGLVITMGAFTITAFIVNQVEKSLRNSVNRRAPDAALGTEGLPADFGEPPKDE